MYDSAIGQYLVGDRMIVQIYEIQDPVEARQVSEAGVDHVGILVGNGEFPREIAPANAAAILAAVPAPSKKVILTLSGQIAAVEEIARHLKPDILHLGSVLEVISPRDVRTLKRKFPRVRIVRSIPIVGQESHLLARQYEGIADFLLLDSHNPDDKQVGATGVIHNWDISRRIVEEISTPIILAGGLGPENVDAAIRMVYPAGVDSKTMTDKTGSHRKDLQKSKRVCCTGKAI
jgi:phosphoribosylanthranilate isomerase